MRINLEARESVWAILLEKWALFHKEEDDTSCRPLTSPKFSNKFLKGAQNAPNC